MTLPLMKLALYTIYIDVYDSFLTHSVEHEWSLQVLSKLEYMKYLKTDLMLEIIDISCVKVF